MRRTLICLAVCLVIAGCAEGRSLKLPRRTWVLAQIDEPREAGDEADLRMDVRFIAMRGEAAAWDLAGASARLGEPGSMEQPLIRMLRVAHEQDLESILAAPALVLRPGEENRNVVISRSTGSRESLLISADGDWVVGTLPDGVLARATLEDYDPSSRSGRVSFEFAVQSAGALQVHARGQSIPFQAGEMFVLAGESPPSG